jgi:hypothetical protein
MVKKVVIKLIGGLGNQMFQYSFGSILEKEFGIEVLYDISFFQNKLEQKGIKTRDLDILNFPVNLKAISQNELNFFIGKGKFINLLRCIKGRPIIIDEFNTEIDFKLFINNSKSVYLLGYFQLFEFYKDHLVFLQNLYSVKCEDVLKDNELLQILKHKETLSIHIRRTDYVTDEITKKKYCELKSDYYGSALEYLKERTQIDHIFVFSDDILFAKSLMEELKVNNFTIISFNQGVNSWKDLVLMSNCTNNIIANSTFSFWGALLNRNSEKMVICPKYWLRDKEKNKKIIGIYPNNWFQI